MGEYHGPRSAHAFVCYLIGRRQARNKEHAYRVYVTESLRLSPQGKCLARSYADVIKPHEDIDVDATIDKVIESLGGGTGEPS